VEKTLADGGAEGPEPEFEAMGENLREPRVDEFSGVCADGAEGSVEIGKVRCSVGGELGVSCGLQA